MAWAAFSTSLRAWVAQIEIRIEGRGRNISWFSTYFALVINKPSFTATYCCMGVGEAEKEDVSGQV